MTHSSNLITGSLVAGAAMMGLGAPVTASAAPTPPVTSHVTTPSRAMPTRAALRRAGWRGALMLSPQDRDRAERSIAHELGMSFEQLHEQFEQGVTLRQVAEQRGVSMQRVNYHLHTIFDAI